MEIVKNVSVRFINPGSLMDLLPSKSSAQQTKLRTTRNSWCNTPGVCHQLSNGFKLNHGMLSSDGDVRLNI